MKKALLIVGGIIVLLVVIASLGGDDPNTAAQTTADGSPATTAGVIATTAAATVQAISAADLYAAYEANEISADQTYGGQTVEVSGVIGDIGLDILDKPYVTLETDGVWSVQCFFSTDDSDALADLAAGQDVSLVGTVDGLAVGTNLTVNDCQIAP